MARRPRHWRVAVLLLVPFAVLAPGVAVGATLALTDRSTPVGTGSWAAALSPYGRPRSPGHQSPLPWTTTAS